MALIIKQSDDWTYYLQCDRTPARLPVDVRLIQYAIPWLVRLKEWCDSVVMSTGSRAGVR